MSELISDRKDYISSISAFNCFPELSQCVSFQNIPVLLFAARCRTYNADIQVKPAQEPVTESSPPDRKRRLPLYISRRSIGSPLYISISVFRSSHPEADLSTAFPPSFFSPSSNMPPPSRLRVRYCRRFRVFRRIWRYIRGCNRYCRLKQLYNTCFRVIKGAAKPFFIAACVRFVSPIGNGKDLMLKRSF